MKLELMHFPAVARKFFTIELPRISPLKSSDKALRAAGSQDVFVRKVTCSSKNEDKEAVNKLWDIALHEGRPYLHDYGNGVLSDPSDAAYVWWMRDDIGHCHALGFLYILGRGSKGLPEVYWFWLHPYVRLLGLVKRVWPFVRKDFPTVTISNEMRRLAESECRASCFADLLDLGPPSH